VTLIFGMLVHLYSTLLRSSLKVKVKVQGHRMECSVLAVDAVSRFKIESEVGKTSYGTVAEKQT